MKTIFMRVAVLGIAGLLVSALPATVSAANPEGSFDEDTLITDTSRPKLEGTTEDVRSVRLVVEDQDGKRVFRSRITKIKNDEGEWKIRIKKKLKDGEYDVTLLGGDRSAEYETLATGTLVIGEEDDAPAKPGKKAGSVYMASLPLLTGGMGTAYASVPVAYVKVGNPSKDTVTVEGFTMRQNGSADASSVASFSTSDDKGGSRVTTKSAWKNGESFVPLNATLAPGEVRIYTVKANLGGSLAAGKTLMLDVAGAETSGSITSGFPIRGTVWTLSR